MGRNKKSYGKVGRGMMAGLLLACACIFLMQEPAQAASPQISSKKISLVVGNSKTLKMKNNKKKVVWRSSKSSVAKVSSKGVVTAQKKGTATVTAKIGKKKYYFSPKNGKMLTGKKKIGKSTYYFHKTGYRKTGWQSISKKKYYFSPQNGKMLIGRKKIGKQYYYFNKKGQLQASRFIHDGKKTYYAGKKGILHTGWLNEEGNTYYFKPQNNQMAIGWQAIDGNSYYFAESNHGKGILQRNCIVSTKQGNYFVDAEGIQVNAPEISQAVAFVKAHTEDGWDSGRKLQRCFDVLWSSYSYQRFYETPTPQSMPGYARYMFENHRGNCYRYAASFACIAKVLGYESRVAVGSISSARGGMTPHGWTEVNVGGVWYMCDANMQRNHPGTSSYMRTEANYAYRHTCAARYSLFIQKGQGSWR